MLWAEADKLMILSIFIWVGGGGVKDMERGTQQTAQRGGRL